MDRICMIADTTGFIKSDFKDIKKGNCFILFDGDNSEPVFTTDGHQAMFAATDAYINEIGIWQVDITEEVMATK